MVPHLLAISIFHRNPGLQFVFRWAHVVVGIVWIGLLFYFNFVQVPSFAQFEAATRNEAIDKLASRALWWFRWAAVFTVLTGLLILVAETFQGKTALFSSNYWKSADGTSIATGILFALIMFLNVWGIIWRNQKVVIANARNVLSGGQADPAAADAGRRAALASRQNTIFTFPMLVFMVGTGTFFTYYGKGINSALSNKPVYWIIMLVIAAVFEANALGLIGGRAAGNITNWIYEDHWRAIGTGIVLSVVVYAVWQIVLG